MERARTRVLIVEDEVKVGAALADSLRADGFDVDLAADGADGFFAASAGDYDVVLLDWMLPRRSGLEVVAALRRGRSTVPVLMLTARDALEDKVAGLDHGADDYLVKPFAIAEVSARIRALLRRGRPETVTLLRAGRVELDRIARRVTLDGAPVDITVREFELLEYLLLHRGHPVTREMLARDVWKLPRCDPTIDNVIDVYIARLRRKVDKEPAHRLVQTIRGVGFLVAEGAT
jgi:DNA-binding response OmpR family regulator